MSDTSYVILREDNSLSSQSDSESPKCKNNQSANRSLFPLNVSLGLLVCLIVLIGGVFVMTRLQTDMTQAGLDWRGNQTHLTQDTRLVPHNIHDMSHRQSVSHQVNVSHSQFHQNDILYNESSFNETTRNKRSLFLTLLLLGMHVKVPTTRVSH